MESIKKKRATLNTTINENVLNGFKAYCKALGIPMNVPLEAFMAQFSSGQFVFKLGKNDKMEVDLED